MISYIFLNRVSFRKDVLGEIFFGNRLEYIIVSIEVGINPSSTRVLVVPLGSSKLTLQVWTLKNENRYVITFITNYIECNTYDYCIIQCIIVLLG